MKRKAQNVTTLPHPGSTLTSNSRKITALQQDKNVTNKVGIILCLTWHCHFCLYYFDKLQFHEKNRHLCLHFFNRLQFHEKNCHFCLHYFDKHQFHEKNVPFVDIILIDFNFTRKIDQQVSSQHTSSNCCSTVVM